MKNDRDSIVWCHGADVDGEGHSTRGACIIFPDLDNDRAVVLFRRFHCCVSNRGAANRFNGGILVYGYGLHEKSIKQDNNIPATVECRNSIAIVLGVMQ